MDNLKNVRISMFDRTNNSSQPVNVVTSANAVIVDGEEKNIKEYVDSSNLINTHISPKVDFGKYNTESDLYGENINDVVSEFIQHYSGGSSNQPPSGPAPTLPMPGSTPAVSTTVPLEFTKRVEALETKLAAIESSGNSTSSATTTPGRKLMFDCIEDIFPIQLDYRKFNTSELNLYQNGINAYKKSNILIVPEQYYFNNNGYGWLKIEKKQPMLCIKFKNGISNDEKTDIMSKLRVELYVKTGLMYDYDTQVTTYKYNRYLYDRSNGMNGFGTHVIGGNTSDPQKILDDNDNEIYRNCVFIRLTNKELDESESEFKYNESYIYTSYLNDSDVVNGVENGNVVISLKDNSNVYKKFVETSVVPQIYTDFDTVDSYSSFGDKILNYEKHTKERNTEFLDNFFKNYNSTNLEIPETLLFDDNGLSLPNEYFGDNGIKGDNYNTFVEDIGKSYRIHYLVKNYFINSFAHNQIMSFAIAMSNTIKLYSAIDSDSPATTFKTFINSTLMSNVFDRSVSASLSAGFQIPQRPIVTRAGVFFVYYCSKINLGQIESLEFTLDLPKTPNIVTYIPMSRPMPNNRFKERDTSAREDHL